MKIKSILFIAFALLFSNSTLLAQTWNLIIPPSAYDTIQLNFTSTAFNQDSSIFYSVYKSGSDIKIQSFNLNSNTTSVISTSNLPPMDLNTFTFDYTNNRLIANRSGRDNLYAVSATGGVWSQIGSGSFDSESYGGRNYWFWNSSNNSTGFFGGYGWFSVKNWIWENSGLWSNPYANNATCDSSNPAKRVGNLTLGAPNSNKVYIFSGYGNCSGDQFATSCSLGSAWANDVGVYCWLKDLWELNLTTHTFKNILPVNSNSISKEGQIVYDYTNNTFYILGGYVPPSTWNSNHGNITDYETGVLRFRVGIDTGFIELPIGGTPPPTVKVNNLGPNSVFYDAANNQIVWARNDGVWAIKTATGCGLSITTQPSSQTINQNRAAQFVVASSDPAASYQWQTDLGNGFVNIQDQGKFSGTSHDTLAIAGVRICNDNQAFRCIVTSGTCVDTSDVATLSVNYDETCIDSNAAVGDPLAVFTSAKVACSTQLNFTNLSINGIVSDWDFGDPASGSNNTSNLSNPSHVFSAAGTYAVTLIAKDGPGCSDTVSRNVVVSAPGLAPVANFTAQIDSGACISKVRFSNTSSNAMQFVWTMADGTENKQTNPSIAFPLAGTYAVKLVAIAATGCTDTLEQNIVINHNSSGAVAKFVSTDSVQCFANHSFNFNNQSMFYGPGYIANYTWDFGDGTTNTTNTFVFNKQYAAAGVYTVKLIARSPGGCADTAYQTVRVIPSADANFNVNIGCSETATIAHFIEPNTTYIWNFGDGNYASHTLDTFNHTFTRPGFYNITLSAYAENACSSTFNLNTFASDGNTPMANFNYAPACGNNIQFDNLTQFGSGFLWNFGDGSPVVSEYEPYHSFPTAGTYNVTLSTFKSATCMHTITLPVVAPQGWNIKLPKAKMAYYVQPCSNIITAKDSGSLESENFKWYFNKVFVDTGAQITLPALAPGDYQIMLISDNVYCTDTAVAGIKIQEAPESLFEIIKDACSNTIMVNNLSKNAISYAWDFGDVGSAHNTANGPSASHTYASNGTYTIRLIAFNSTGCSDTISLPVTLTNAAAASKANFNYTYGLCNCKCDNYIRFQNLTPGTNTYLWSLGNGVTTVLSDFVKGFPKAGNYPVTLTAVDSVGCMSSHTKTVSIESTVSGPNASFNTDHQVQCLDKNSFNFYNTSSYVGSGWIKKFYWYFGDGTMDSSSSFIFNKKYAGAGNYIVTLVAISADDCRDTMSMYVQVRPLPCSGVLKFVNLQDGSNWNIDPKLNDGSVLNGLAKQAAQSQYSLNPNPSNGNFSIQFKNPINEAISLSVIDILGKEVYQKTHAPMGLNQLQVEAESLAAGTYLLHITSENQTYKDQKFVVIK